MVLSITEKSYLHDSLAGTPLVRPDGRTAHQFRPIEVVTNFLPTSNGSSRVMISDGSECIVSVKSKVVEYTENFDDLIEVDVDIATQRDDSVMVESLNSLLNKALQPSKKGIDISKLRLTKRYSFKLFIDVVVLSSYSHPISLISFAIYSALNSTYLPKLISNFDDLEVEELPIFHDYDLVKLDLNTPLVFLCAVVGNNILFDPATNECEVANAGIIMTWSKGKVISPIRTIALNGYYETGLDPQLLQSAATTLQRCAPEVSKALEN